VLIKEVNDAMRHFEQIQKDARQKLYEVDQRIVAFSVNHLIDALKNKYSKFTEVVNFLAEVREHLLKNVQAF